MDPIIAPIDPQLIKQELTPDKLLRITNKLNNEVYVFRAHECPNTMLEVGRQREIAFREGGGGSGKSSDIDDFDRIEDGYQQLIVWNPKYEAIIGGYRFINGKDVVNHPMGVNLLATSHMFEYSEEFIRNYLPKTIELGRSFVSRGFQSTDIESLSIFALDNLWDGLGALTVIHPDIKYFFGKVTMYANYNRHCRNLILYFMDLYFHDDKDLVTPKQPLTIDLKDEDKSLFLGCDMKKDFRTLKQELKKLNINIPPLFNAYISLSPDLIRLGTAINYEFSNVEETGILINIDQILEEKKNRHIHSYKPTQK